jgi:hypothetical protein
MTVGAEECDVQGLVIVPVMALEAHPTSAPGTGFWPLDQSELLAECGCVSRRASPNASRTEDVATNFQVATKTGELGVLAIPSALFHDALPVLKPGSPHESSDVRRRFPLHRRSPFKGHPTDSW